MSGLLRIGFSTTRLSSGRVTRVHGKTRDQKAYHHQRMRLVRNEINLVPSKNMGWGACSLLASCMTKVCFWSNLSKERPHHWVPRNVLTWVLRHVPVYFRGGCWKRWLGVVMWSRR